MLYQILQKINEEHCYDSLSFGWEESCASLPIGAIDPLSTTELIINGEWTGLPPQTLQSIQGVAQRINKDENLRALWWHAYRSAYLLTEPVGYENYPSFKQSLGDMAGVFYLTLAISGARFLRQNHHLRNIPEEITAATFADIGLWVKHYKMQTQGELGLAKTLIPWFRLHASGELYRLGRLQYVLEKSNLNLQVFRKRSCGSILALSSDNIHYDRHGYVDGVGGEFDKEQGWTSTLAGEGEYVCGNPISPYGVAMPIPYRLSLSEWEWVLAPGDYVLTIHIPDGEPMTLESCRNSLLQAMPFFQRYYTNRAYRAFVCRSWLLNPELELMLSERSNLVQFLQQAYLFPIRHGRYDGLNYVFYQNRIDPTTAPRDTRLRRAMLEWMEAGKPLRSSGGFILPQNLPEFGTQFYRRNTMLLLQDKQH